LIKCHHLLSPPPSSITPLHLAAQVGPRASLDLLSYRDHGGASIAPRLLQAGACPSGLAREVSPSCCMRTRPSTTTTRPIPSADARHQTPLFSASSANVTHAVLGPPHTWRVHGLLHDVHRGVGRASRHLQARSPAPPLISHQPHSLFPDLSCSLEKKVGREKEFVGTLNNAQNCTSRAGAVSRRTRWPPGAAGWCAERVSQGGCRPGGRGFARV
jgi:hypothetical protein